MQIFLQLQEFLQFQNKFNDFLQFQKLELWIEDIEKWPVALFMHWNGVFWASRHTKIYKISGTTHLAPARTRWCRFAPVLSCKFILSYLHPWKERDRLIWFIMFVCIAKNKDSSEYQTGLFEVKCRKIKRESTKINWKLIDLGRIMQRL